MNTDYLKMCGEAADRKQMSEAFLNNMFWHCPADSRMPIPIMCAIMYFPNAQTGNVVLMSQTYHQRCITEKRTEVSGIRRFLFVFEGLYFRRDSPAF